MLQKLIFRSQFLKLTKISSRSVCCSVKLKNKIGSLNPNSPSDNFLAVYGRFTDVIQQAGLEIPHLKTDFSAWKNFIGTLKEFDFHESEIFQIISRNPHVLTIPPSNLHLSLTRWNQSQLGSEFVKDVITSQPSYLFVPLPVIEKRLGVLQGLSKKPKTLANLLIECPNLMTERWEQIDAKIDYLTNVMRVEKQEICSCQALSKTLNQLKMRHRLLETCGLYVAPSPYEHKRVQNDRAAFRNPPLKRIVDNEDISFARKICKISHEEFLAFQELFEADVRAEEDEELNSDSDSDSDSDGEDEFQRRGRRR